MLRPRYGWGMRQASALLLVPDNNFYYNYAIPIDGQTIHYFSYLYCCISLEIACTDLQLPSK